MAIVPWPEWLPDQADFGSPGSPVIKNCVPLTAGSYGPMPSASPYSNNTLDERCQGAYSIKAPDGGIYIFAGDRTKLYELAPGSRDIQDVSRVAGGAYATPEMLIGGGHWQMTSFGDRVIAVNGVDEPQTLILGDANFVALQPGDPLATPVVPAAPVAKFVAVVKDFVFFASTIDVGDGTKAIRVWWSGINDPTNWPTPGSTEALQVQSDFQDLQQTDLGNITGLASGFAPGNDVAIFCERGIYTASYVGPPLIFNFRVAQGASGTKAPKSIVQDHFRDSSGTLRPCVYYLSSEGFAAFDGVTSTPIGAQKFDRRFFQDLDDAYMSSVLGTREPRSRSIIWAYATVGSEGFYSRMLVYNWELGRATTIELEPTAHLDWITTAMYGTQYNLDTIDSFGDSETITPNFDDPFWTGNTADQLTLFDKDHRLNVGGGPPMAPTLETGESQPNPGRRSWCRMSVPLNDGANATIAVGHRERQSDPVTWEAPVAVNELGECPQRCTGRYLRYRLSMPAGEYFRHLQGLDIDVIPEASRR